jgi:hypothetical protein
MSAVDVNHLHFREPPDPNLFARAGREVAPRTSAIEGFREFPVVQAASDHFILIITGDSPAVRAGNAARCATQP